MSADMLSEGPQAVPYPSAENAFLAEHVSLLCDSLRQLTGRGLVPDELSAEEAAKCVWKAPFAVLSHNTASDPVLNYANQAALSLFEMSWEELITTPSRFTAEEMERAERQRLLKRVTADGYIDDYAGVRISKTGRRFQITNATVWNLIDKNGTYRGQAATFDNWTFL